MPCNVRRVARVLASVLSVGTALAAGAQALPSAASYADSRVDLSASYGWFHPLNSGIDGKQYQDVSNPNLTLGASYFFNRFVGVQAELGYFSGEREHAIYNPVCAHSMCDQLVYTAEAGPVLRFPLGKFVPFLHALGGGERTNGPVSQPLTWGWGVTGGAGLDYVLPFWGKHVAVRPLQADWQYSQVVYGPLVLPAGVTGGFGEISALKLSGGVVARFGEPEAARKLQVGCTVTPISVYPGDPVTVTASSMGFDVRRKATYSWQANGGRLTSHEETATIDTASMTPGEYSVRAQLSQGPHARQKAECMATFEVKAILPPTLSCSANPSTAISGTTIDILATASSPANRPLTYSYSTTAGEITGQDAKARLTTAGLDATNITVTCTVADDLNQRASAQTTVTVSKPAVPVIPDTQRLCQLSFQRDRRRPVRVDNEAKACLDDVALTLSQQADAHLVMVGNASPDENPTAAAERALNARQYLTQEKGIERGRIEVRVGQTSGRTLDNILVPSGASYSDPNTSEFDEHAIVRHGEAYGIHHGSAAPILPHAKASGASTPAHRRSTRKPVHRRAAAEPSAATESSAPSTAAAAPQPLKAPSSAAPAK